MSSLTTAWLLSWALVIAYAVPVAVIVYRLDLFEREPKLVLAAAVVWGAVIATSMAAQANDAWLSILSKVASPDLASQWGAAIVGPGVEETLKLAGVTSSDRSGRSDGVLDGFVYGAMVGLGFTVVEDVSYFITAVAAPAHSISPAPSSTPSWSGSWRRLCTACSLHWFDGTWLPRTSPLADPWPCPAVCGAVGCASSSRRGSRDLELAVDGGHPGHERRHRPSTLQWLEYGAVRAYRS